MTTADERISCRGQCGASVADMDQAQHAGWSYLMITAGWRCGACERALLAAASIKGNSGEPGVDTLPPTSRGALPKETASTIVPPAVKG